MATVGSVYAKAVFELAMERNELDGVVEQLRAFWDVCLSHAGLRAALAGPAIDPQSRCAILEDSVKALGVSGVAHRLLAMLAAGGRLACLPDVLEELTSLVEASRGVRSGRVCSAVELSQEEVAELEVALAKRVGGKVRLAPSVDSSLLGGVVATVAGRTFDASLRTQIERFKSELI